MQFLMYFSLGKMNDFNEYITKKPHFDKMPGHIKDDYFHVGNDVYFGEANKTIEFGSGFGKTVFIQVDPKNPETYVNGMEKINKKGWKKIRGIYRRFGGVHILDVLGNGYNTEGKITKKSCFL